MWKAFFQPQHEKWRWFFSLGLAFYIIVFIAYYQPFKGEYVTYIWETAKDPFVYNFLNFLWMFFCCTFVIIVLPRYFPDYFKTENVTYLKLGIIIVFTTFLISLSFFYINHVYFHQPISLAWYIYFFFQMVTSNMVFIGIPYVVIYLLFFSYSIQQQALKEAMSQRQTPFDGQIMEDNASRNQHVAQPISHNSTVEQAEATTENSDISASKILTFKDTSNKKTMQMSLDKLYYITSAQNYIEIFHENKEAQLTRTVLRNTLKLIEEEMIDAEKLPLIRCHKAFIVNREKILELTSSSKLSQFTLKNIDTPIPVSRDKIQEYKGQFSTASDLV
jgi:hypothetical protein